MKEKIEDTFVAMPGNVPPVVYGFRITHYKNLPFILQHGLHCPSSNNRDPNYINIGNKDIIQKREKKRIELPPYGSIHDYVSFYFGPKSPMLYAIHMGASDTACKQQDIIYLVTSLTTLDSAKLPFIFTTGQAIMQLSTQHNNTVDLQKLDWEIIFGKYWHDNPPQYVDRKRKRMAELLVYNYVPVSCIVEIGVFNKEVEAIVTKIVSDAGSMLQVKQKREWYY